LTDFKTFLKINYVNKVLVYMLILLYIRNGLDIRYPAKKAGYPASGKKNLIQTNPRYIYPSFSQLTMSGRN